MKFTLKKAVFIQINTRKLFTMWYLCLWSLITLSLRLKLEFFVINQQEEEKMAAKKSAKMAARKKPSAKPTSGATLKKIAPANKPYTKTEIMNTISALTGVTKKHVSQVIEALEKVIEAHLKKGGAGMFTVPGLVKLHVVHKPATRARKGINPFTGEETTFKAKPARNVVKAKPLKKLKDMV